MGGEGVAICLMYFRPSTSDIMAVSFCSYNFLHFNTVHPFHYTTSIKTFRVRCKIRIKWTCFSSGRHPPPLTPQMKHLYWLELESESQAKQIVTTRKNYSGPSCHHVNMSLCQFLATFVNFSNICQHLEVFGNCWQHLETFGNFWQLLQIFDTFRHYYIITHYNFWQYLVTFDHIW